MIQGTTSDAGKSTLVAGLCRVLVRQRISVAPFKPQNMALNSAVTIDGGEIGRAQAVQALACGIPPHTDMNPVLLKPNTDIGAQVIVRGHAIGNMEADAYHKYKPELLKSVVDSFQRLAGCYDAIVIEGAGSPAEINLRDRDIANMGFAEAVDCPVILIADIDRGGVFAHIVGTLALMSASEQERIKGFVINRFRGDIALLQSGLDWLEHRTSKPVLGVLPYLQGFHLEAEDAIPVDNPLPPKAEQVLRIAVPVLPRISNHTDFDPLRLHPQVQLEFIGPTCKIPDVDLIILPGSKSVIADLKWMKTQQWDLAIQRHLRYGGKVLAVCGGFQMLGNWLHDPEGVEGPVESVSGLGIFEMESTLTPIKRLKNIKGHLTMDKVAIQGYEIHTGVSAGKALDHPAVITDEGCDGAVSDDNQVLGTYIHGLFDQTEACNILLQWAGLKQPKSADYIALRDAEIDRLADALENHMDIGKVMSLLNLTAS